MKNISLKKILTILILSIFLILSNCYNKPLYNKENPKAIKGVMNLRNWDLAKDGSVNLDGEWEFYWCKLLNPEDFNDENPPEMTGYFNIPGVWNNYKIHGEKISNIGYGTHRLTILLNDQNKTLGIKIMGILTSYSIYVNGKQVGTAGKIGNNIKNSKPKYLPQIINFDTSKNKLEIILQISNYHLRQGGPWEGIKLGTIKQIRKIWELDLIINFFLLGSIIMIAFYHLGFFFIRKKDKPALFFSLFCFMIALRLLTTAETYVLHFFPELNWELLIKLEYLSFFTSVPLFILFVYSIFPKEFSKRVLYSIIVISTLFSLFTIITPARISSYCLLPYQITTIITAIYVIYFFIIGAIKKIEFSLIFLLGFLVVFISIINDILHARGIIHSIYTVPIALFIFILFKSFILSFRFSRAFTLIETQKEELFKTNLAFKHKIKENRKLTKNLVKSNRNNLNARLALILGLAKLAEFRDKDTGGHLERIREYSRFLALELKFNPKYKNYITEEYVDDLYYSSILHDIGKVGIPDSILLKPGKLTTEEFEIIKKHPVIGGDAINGIESKMNNRSYLTLAREIAYYHHEKWDGTGYPEGLKEDNIPLSARIVALVDVYDALISKRIYKGPVSHKKAVKIINENRGTHFDPDIVDAFNKVSDQFYEIQKNLK